MSGSGTNLISVIVRIEDLSPARGFYLEYEKSHCVQGMGVMEGIAWLAMSPLYCDHREGEGHKGGG